jgi:hypothetical protein
LKTHQQQNGVSDRSLFWWVGEWRWGCCCCGYDTKDDCIELGWSPTVSRCFLFFTRHPVHSLSARVNF